MGRYILITNITVKVWNVDINMKEQIGREVARIPFTAQYVVIHRF
jgi:hypothetical protein